MEFFFGYSFNNLLCIKNINKSNYYAAGEKISGFKMIGIAGDYMSAASFLGISGLVFFSGFDGLIYSIGFLVDGL